MQSVGVGLAGIALALPLIAGLGLVVALVVGVGLFLPWWLLGSFLGLTALMALLSLRLMDPVTLLR